MGKKIAISVAASRASYSAPPVAKASSAQLILFEKEEGPGCHQTGHNSGVLHCGPYYKPGSTKARMAVQGIRNMVAFCAEHWAVFSVEGARRSEAERSACLFAGFRLRAPLLISFRDGFNGQVTFGL